MNCIKVRSEYRPKFHAIYKRDDESNKDYDSKTDGWVEKPRIKENRVLFLDLIFPENTKIIIKTKS
tara:strand:+ start:1513 stop:1710 length:198 start_codon:yes stop_codon:yes gene_type:complete